jgi:homoserine kinase
MRPDEAVAFAPASVGNVAVGFDVLGPQHERYGGPCSRAAHAGTRHPDRRIEGVVHDMPLDTGKIPVPEGCERAAGPSAHRAAPTRKSRAVLNRRVPLSDVVW